MDLVDQILEDHDSDVLEMKKKVENMWKDKSTKRERKTVSCREAPGVSFFGDNVGECMIINFLATCSLYIIQIFTFNIVTLILELIILSIKLLKLETHLELY